MHVRGRVTGLGGRSCPTDCGVHRLVSGATALLVAATPSCQQPTEVVLELTTDVSCPLRSAQITAGAPDDVEKRRPNASTSTCSGAGSRNQIGSLVLVPSEGNQRAALGVRIVAGVDVPVEACQPPDYRGCIVARRSLRFLENKRLTLPVILRTQCKTSLSPGAPSLACGTRETCVRGACVPWEIDPAKCLGSSGCGESVLISEPDGGVINPCNAGNGPDADGDGFTEADGDCDDCDASANPGAFDFPSNNRDEDCSGTADDADVSCDSTVGKIDDPDPLAGARAIGLCNISDGIAWGIIEARYTKADGSPGMNPLSHGVLGAFGPNVAPREGKRLLALSSGAARTPTDPGFIPGSNDNMGTSGGAPPGFPAVAPQCGGSASTTEVNDTAALDLTLRIPTNAKSIAFDFNFYSSEFPEWVQTVYNDAFVTLLSPAPSGALNGNVAFDGNQCPINVSGAFMQVCSGCALGVAGLQGTGFESDGATGWLTSHANVPPGEVVRLRFAIWDTADSVLDSLVLIDNVRWSPNAAPGTSTTPVPR